MKRLWIVVCVVVVACVFFAVIGVATVGTLIAKGAALDQESQAYVDEVTPLILADLQTETIFKYASDELKNAAPREEFDKVFEWFKQLGAFEKYHGSEGQARFTVTTHSGRVIHGEYTAQAEFETGPARVRIVTVKKGNQWFVQLFTIHSDALAANLSKFATEHATDQQQADAFDAGTLDGNAPEEDATQEDRALLP